MDQLIILLSMKPSWH